MEWKVKTLSLARKKGFQEYLTTDMDRKVDKYKDRNADTRRARLQRSLAPFFQNQFGWNRQPP